MKAFSSLTINALFVFCCASPAMASFARSTCSSSDGSIRYEYSMDGNEPLVTNWIINQHTESINESLVEHSMQQVVEQTESPMTSSRTIIEKITFKKGATSDENELSIWWICSSVAGI